MPLSLTVLGQLARAPRTTTLLGCSWVVVAAVRAGLCALPSRVVLRTVATLVERLVIRERGGEGRHPVRVARVVIAAARRVPAATCLTQALAGQILLAYYGHHSRLRIGVARDAAGGFKAHAWLESHGGVVLGGEALGEFTPMPDVAGALR